jgi:hypothetical protein
MCLRRVNGLPRIHVGDAGTQERLAMAPRERDANTRGSALDLDQLVQRGLEALLGSGGSRRRSRDREHRGRQDDGSSPSH